MASNSKNLTAPTGGGSFTLKIEASATNQRLDQYGNPLSDVTIKATLSANNSRFRGSSIGTLEVLWCDTFGYPSWVSENSTNVTTFYPDYYASASTEKSFTVQHDGNGNLTGYAQAKWTRGGNDYQPASGSVDVTLSLPHIDLLNYINYNANGGTGAPSQQGKEKGTTIYISNTIPTRTSSTSNGYTITYNGNTGTIDKSSDISYLRTTYTFTNWNTKQDGSGTVYMPGAAYSTDADLQLYAQWNSSTARDAIALPGGLKGGYSLVGFGTSSTSTSPVANPYTPTGNITLYAIWEEISKKVKIKDGNNWIVAPRIKVKINNSWYIVTNVNIL